MSDQRWLYVIGGIATALLATLTLLHAAVFFVAGLPNTVVDWITLFQRDRLLGLLAFELLMIAYVVLSIPVTLALHAALRRAAPSLMGLYVAVSLVGIVLFIVSRPAFEMLSLSTGYAAAVTESERAHFLAAAESTLAIFHGTAFWVSYVLGSAGGLLVSAVMLRTTVFGKPTAYLRIASSVLDLGLFVPVIGLYISLLSVLCLLAFNILVARRLFRLGIQATT
jgi:hypothetical protein